MSDSDDKDLWRTSIPLQKMQLMVRDRDQAAMLKVHLKDNLFAYIKVGKFLCIEDED